MGRGKGRGAEREAQEKVLCDKHRSTVTVKQFWKPQSFQNRTQDTYVHWVRGFATCVTGVEMQTDTHANVCPILTGWYGHLDLSTLPHSPPPSAPTAGGGVNIPLPLAVGTGGLHVEQSRANEVL